MTKSSSMQSRSKASSALRPVGEYAGNVHTFTSVNAESVSRSMPTALPSFNIAREARSGQFQTTSSSSRESYRSLNSMLSLNKNKR